MSYTASAPQTRRVVSAAAAVSLGLLGVALTASVASAAPVSGPVDDSLTGSLTIHKFAFPADGSQNPSGTGTDPSSPLAGVSFEVCEVGNITSLGDSSNAGWSQVLGLNALSATGGTMTGSVAGVDTTTSFPLSNCTTVVSGADGATPIIDNLPVGAYLVTETVVPAGVIAGDPFVVTVPTPADTTAGASNSGTWEYDVNVYPKNTRATVPVKTIGDQPANGVELGDVIDFSISQTIPSLPTGQNYTKVTVTDVLDTKLDLVAGSVVVAIDGTPLTLGTDYTLDTTGDVVTVTLTGALATIAAGDVLTVDLSATANAVGSIDNTAVVNVNDLDVDGDGEPGTPTNPVTTRWGNLLGEKTDASGATNLGGAEFDVYMTTDTDGTCGPVTTADLASATLVTSVTSAADGTIAVPGLWVGDTNNDVTDRCYILQETAAPAGFVLPTGDAALDAVNITSDATVTVPSFAIANDQQLVPGLPLTGADGQRALMIAGGALALLAVGGVLVSRRRQRASV